MLSFIHVDFDELIITSWLYAGLVERCDDAESAPEAFGAIEANIEARNFHY